MGCGCMDNKVKEFYYVDAHGKETKHATKLQAEAAKIKAGGAGRVVERAKL